MLKDLTCKYRGDLFTISDSDISSNVIEKISSYYTYFQIGVNISNPLWSERFSDANTGEIMTAISFPIYYEYKNGHKRVLGAAAISVPFSYFSHYNITS